jgi:LPXTG-motif cell wall-anchored protein
MLRLGMLKFDGKEEIMLASGTAVQVVAGVLAAAVLGIIVYRRKQKAV